MSWKKLASRVLLAALALILIIVGGALIWVHTAAFNRFVIRKMAAATEQSTGQHLTIQKLAIRWIGLSADVYGLELHKPSLPEPPFLVCKHVYASVEILSLWRRKFVLDDVVVDDPVLRVLINAHGENNLPYSRKPSSESAADGLFDLGIRHFRLNSGELHYNEQKIPVSADLRNVNATVAFHLMDDAYQGSFAYDHGRVSAPHFIPVEHALQMTFDAMRTTFHIKELNLVTGQTRLTVEATLENYAQPHVQATYQAAIFTPDLARVLHAPSLPVGEVSTAGTMQYEYRAQGPFLRAIKVAGRLDSPELQVHSAGIVADPRDIRAAYMLADGDIRVTDIAAQLLGGAVRGTFTMRDLERTPRSTVQAYLADASLTGLTQSLPAHEPESVRLSGRVNATVEAAWAGTIREAIAHVHATIASPPTLPSHNVIPVNAALDLRYDGPRDVATFAPSTLETGSTKVSFNGTLSRHSSIDVQANAHDLHELVHLISSLQSGPSTQKESSLASLDLRGSATFAGRIAGSPEAPSIQGQLTGTDIAVKGTTLRSIQAGLGVDASHIAIQNARIKGPSKEQLTLSGEAGLQRWALNRESQMSIQANASGISLEQIEQLANTHYRLNGELSASVSVHGTSENPVGTGSIEITQPLTGNGVKKIAGSKRLATIHLESDGNEVHATAQLRSPAGAASANVTYAMRTEQYSGRVDAPNIDLSKVQLLVARGVPLSGLATLEANGRGTIKNPQLDARLAIPDLQIQQQTVSNIVAQLRLTDHRASFNLDSTVIGGYAKATGDVTLLGNYPANLSVNVRAVPIGPLLARYVPTIPDKLQGQTELHATLSGPLKRPNEIKAQVQIPTLDLAYESVRMGLAEPMRIDYANGTASLAKTEIKGTGTDLTLEGTIPLKNPKALDVAANGSIDLSILHTLEPGWQSSGRILIHIGARAGSAQPTMQGQIEIEDATFLTDTMPLAFESLNGKIGLNGTRLEINQLQATTGGGTLTATGFFDYAQQKSFDLNAVAKTVRLRYPTGIRTVLEADLKLAGTKVSSNLTGRVVVDRLSFTQNFDLDRLFGQFSSEMPSVAPSGFQQNVKLNVAVVSSQSLEVSSSRVSIGGNFNLTVSGTLGTPVVLGRISLTQGEIFFMGKRYDLQSGTVEFRNPVRTEPVLNIYANTTVNQYKITINFIGPLERLVTHYTSDPPLSQADIIHLIAFGNTAEAAASAASTPATLAAESAVANQVTSVLSGKLETLTGISQISIDPLIPNTVANPSSQIAIQERVSGSLLVTYATDVTNTQSQTVEVQYRASKNVKISIIRDYNGGYGVDIRIHKTF